MKRWTELLKRKFGPLPAWAWFVLLAIGVYWYRKKHPAAPPATPPDTAATVPPATTDVSGDGSGYIYYPPGSTPPPGSNPPPTTTPPPGTQPPPASYPSGYWQHHQHTEFGDNLWLYWNSQTQQWMTVSDAEAAGVPAPPSSWQPGQKYPPGSYGASSANGSAATGALSGVVITAKSMISGHVTKPPVGPRPRPHWEGPPDRIGHGGGPPHPPPHPKRPGYTLGSSDSHRLRTVTGGPRDRHRPPPAPTTTGVNPRARDRAAVTPGPSGIGGRHRSPVASKTGSSRDKRSQS